MEETKASDTPSTPTPQPSIQERRICLTCFDPKIQLDESLRCNHGIYAKHMTIWHSFVNDPDDGVQTLHATPGHSTCTFCCLASMNPDLSEKLEDRFDAFYGDTPPPRLVRIDEDTLTTIPLTMEICAKIILSFCTRANPFRTSPFIQGSFPLYLLEKIVMGSEPSWKPKDIDFFIPHQSATRFAILLKHIQRDFPVKAISTSHSQHRLSMAFGDVKIPFDLTNLRIGRTRQDVRDAADISLSKVQICTTICPKDDFSIHRDGLWIVGEESILEDIRHREFTWWRAPMPKSFTHTLLRMIDIWEPKPSCSMEDLNMKFPSDLIDIMREVDPEVFGLTPEILPGEFLLEPERHERTYDPSLVDDSLVDSALLEDSLMGGTVRLCPSLLCEHWHYYLDFSNRVWISDNLTFCTPGLHPDHPRGNISILDLVAFCLLKDPKHHDKIILPSHPFYLTLREKVEPTGMSAANILAFGLDPDTLGIYMMCDVCGLKVTGSVYTDVEKEFDMCLRCAEEYKDGYYKHFYDHVEEAKVKRRCRRYHASVLRKKKYVDRGFAMKVHVKEDPRNENVEYV